MHPTTTTDLQHNFYVYYIIFAHHFNIYLYFIVFVMVQHLRVHDEVCHLHRQRVLHECKVHGHLRTPFHLCVPACIYAHCSTAAIYLHFFTAAIYAAVSIAPCAFYNIYHECDRDVHQRALLHSDSSTQTTRSKVRKLWSSTTT